jgi:HD-GYP domain-containing protein (c-di-GMP phosphodiesterase class II)
MTMRLDIVTNDAGELVRREHARDLGANVVLAIYRLAKLAQLHDLANQAFQRQLEQTHAAIVEYGLRAGTNVNILFAQKAVFVAGQLLKGNRATYDQASELGDILEWCGGSELLVQRDVTPQELYQFGEAISIALRSEKGKGYRAPSPRIRLRAVADAARLRGLEIEALSPDQRVVRTYASAVVIMRRFFEDLTSSHYILPRRIKRVAQSLVDLSDGSTPAFLGVTEVRNQNHDAAGRAVNTAILAVTMAREVTNDRVLLAQIAMAAMMHDVGRPRAAALSTGGGPAVAGMAAKISEDAEDKLAAGTAAVLTALGRVNEPTIMRTVVAYEALWMRRQKFIGPLYQSLRLPTIHAKVLQIARRYNDLLTPEPGLPPPTPDFAIATLSDEMPDPADRTIVRMLVSALGLYPVGTVVQLTSNEVAEVAPSPRDRTAPFDLPIVRVVMDARGGVVDRVVELDLANPPPGEPQRRIARVVSVDGWRKGLERPGGRSPSQGSGTHPLREEGPGWLPSGGASEPPSASVPSIASINSLRAREAPSNPSPSGSGVVEISRDGSYPSSGTSPSMVAQAMGRVMAEGAPRRSDPVRASPLNPSLATGAAEGVAPVQPQPAQQARSAPSGAVKASSSPSTAGYRDLAPTARGTLASTPIVHVLVYMLDHVQTGTVVLREPDSSGHLFYFHEGAPSKARLGKPLALLGEQLIAHGAAPYEAVAKAIESSRRMDTLLGEFMVETGVLAPEVLAAELATQVGSKIAALVNLPPETDYAFYAGKNLLEGWGGGELTPCHPLNAILASVRSWHDRARIRATLGRIAKQPLAFHPDADLSVLLLTPEEQAVLDAIAATRSTITTLYQQRVADEDVVSTIVYTLAVTRCFGFTATKGLPMTSPAFARRAPPVMIQSAPPGSARSFPPMSALGVTDPPVAGASIPSAPMGVESQPPPVSARSAMAWKPARVPVSDVVQPGARPLPEPVARPSDPGSPGTFIPPRSVRPEPKRDSVEPPEPAVPVTAPAPPAEPQDESERALEAMADFRKADTALQRNDLATAERLAKKAVTGDPENAEYRALVSWLTALSGTKDAVKEALHGLNDVLKDDALCERALLYRGKLFKKENRNSEALRDFMTALDVNPKNNEAASEVRLLRMKKKR